MTRVCMLSQAQPSTNPRLVKEADALTEAGYDVQVLCSHHVQWARETDHELLASRRWKCTYIGEAGRVLSEWQRLRHKGARITQRYFAFSRMTKAAAGRNVPALAKAASACVADLYIARHPGALAAAGRAAHKHRARLGYDAEDFESGHGALNTGEQSEHLSQDAAQQDRIAFALEQRWLPYCNYVTAGSPAIADAYAEKYGIPRPTPILNVFPLRERPATLRSVRPGPLRLYWFSQTIGADRGLQDVVRAMSLVPACNIELHLRGEWALGFEQELRSLAASLQIPQQRIVRHVPAAPDEMIRLAAEFDVGLALEQPVSRNRLLCLTNKLFTYMLAGNAIAATLTPGQQPVLRSIGAAAVSYKQGDIATLAAGLKRWHDDREALARARQSSWQWGSDRYNWDLEKQWFLKTVEQALAPVHGGSADFGVAARA
jgi:glycosyltransferase involved in cell wall biosynthesis